MPIQIKRTNMVLLQTRRSVLAMAAGLATAASVRAHATPSDWPAHPIRLIVPFAPGGPPDVVARVIADPLSQALKGTIVVENKAGAGGTLGVMDVAHSDPDGYTLLIGTSALVVNKAVNPTLKYDPEADLTPICEIANAPNVFVTSSKMGIDTLPQFIAYARATPNGASYSSPGRGTTPQLSSELLRARAGINLTHVPYNSGPMAVQALLSGLVQLSCTALPLVQPQIEAGALKALAVTGPQRWRALPNVPTMAEAGFPDFVLDTMVMLEAPARIDAWIVDKLSQSIQQVLRDPAIRKVLETSGFDVVAKGPAQLANRIHKEIKQWNEVVATTGMREP